MKLKFRLVIFFTILFILYVSYKILEPEISGRNLQIVEEQEFRRLKVKQQIDNGAVVLSNSKNKSHNRSAIQISEVIEILIEKFKVDSDFKLSGGLSPWQLAASWFSSRSVHPNHTPELGAVIKALAERPIISANVFPKGSQLKLLFYLEGGQKVVFKPKQFERDFVIKGNPYSGEDRHNGEIAAFHLGRLFDFRRTPIAVGRRVNLVTEVKAIANSDLLKTFFSRDNKTCFYGKCLYCKGPETGLCADNNMFEGTMVLYLPPKVRLKLNSHPWRRSYRDGKNMAWEVDNEYCAKDILTYDLYKRGPRLLDIVDTCVLDYLTGNADRHHYHTIDGEEDSMLIMLDNGKSFGNPYTDERSILAPLYQCCRIRQKLWNRLLLLQDGILSGVMTGLLSQDPISPVLTEHHLLAMDRRLGHVVQIVEKCVSKFSKNIVFTNQR